MMTDSELVEITRMRGHTSETQPTMTPSPQRYARWKQKARGIDVALSESIEAMIEPGLKNFDAGITADESSPALRQRRNELGRELDQTRDWVRELEAQVHALHDDCSGGDG